MAESNVFRIASTIAQLVIAAIVIPFLVANYNSTLQLLDQFLKSRIILY